MLKTWTNANELWADVLVETLNRKGVDYAITCPGSRSSPLTIAFARNAATEAIPALDERSAGFFALGIAKRTGKPVAVVCTSGSAVANLFPAVVEASEWGTPLLLLTSDRPPELRDCAAGQAIDQVKLFGGYVRKQIELPLPASEILKLRHLRQSLSFLTDLSSFPNRGPVHVNCPFREPLIPTLGTQIESPFPSQAEYETFFSQLRPVESASYGTKRLPLEEFVERGLILAGPSSPVNEEAWCGNVSALANRLGWPLLSDALNPIRSNADRFDTLICGYEYLLRNEALRRELQPEHVIVIGCLPTSKTLRHWLETLDVPMTFLADRPVNRDATHSRSNSILVDLEFDCIEVAKGEPGAYLERWLELEDIASSELLERIQECEALVEPKVSWLLSRCLPEWSALCVSNSMPPRDMEYYFEKRIRPLSVYSSRGANGIDGIVSTAMGIAHEGEPTYLLIGDLALLHDTNGLLLAKSLIGSLTIILVNNSGGGIFEMLPVAKLEDVFEKYYATDQGIDFSELARTYGIAYQKLSDWDAFRAKLGETVEGVRLLEIQSSRKGDAGLRKRWFSEIAQALD